MTQAEIQNILSKTLQEDAPSAPTLQSSVSEITSMCVCQSAAGGTDAFIQMQFLFEGEQSRSEEKSYFWKGEVSDALIDICHVKIPS